MKKRRGNEEQSMDALMDTLTNVVGILMFVLMITMLSVSEAVKQILRAEKGYDKKEITEQDLDNMRNKAAQLEDEVRAMALKETDVRTTLTGSRLSLTKLQTQATREQASIEKPDPRQIEQIKARITEREKTVEEIEKQVREMEKQKEAVGSQLAKAPEIEEEAAKIVRLPDPREAPKSATQELYFCREGRLIYVNVDGFSKLALALARKTTQPENNLIDCDALISAFEERAIGDRNFTVGIMVRDFRPYAVFNRKPGAGESVEDLDKPDCDFRTRILKMNKKREYCRFLVWPDSFDVYIKAREIVDDSQVMAGWQPLIYAPEWIQYVPGITQYRCKGSPPPPPPTASQAAQGPPKPADVID